MMVI
jgi:hypothetical protein